VRFEEIAVCVVRQYRVRQLMHGGHRHQTASHVVDHSVHRTHGRSGNRRNGHGRSLQDADGKPLAMAGKNKNVRGRVPPFDIFTPPDQTNRRLCPERCRHALSQGSTTVQVAGDYQYGVIGLRPYYLPSLDQVLNAFVSTEPTNKERDELFRAYADRAPRVLLSPSTAIGIKPVAVNAIYTAIPNYLGPYTYLG